MKKIALVTLAFVFALAMPAVAFAATGSGGGNGGGGGNGSGGGNGGGSSTPLVVESASIESGAEIGAGDTITLVFSKNVCDASVREANAGLVAIEDSQGNAVQADVVLADDQVEPDKRNDIVVGFAQEPEAGSYVLTAKAGIASKSGDVLAEDYVLEFTVAAAQSESSASAASASASSASTSAQSASASAASATSSAAGQQSGPNVLIIAVAVIAVAAIAIGAVVLFKKKK